MREKVLQPTSEWQPVHPDMGNGRMMEVSVSPVGKGTAGLLVMNCIPPAEGAGDHAGAVAGGEAVILHGSAGDERNVPPDSGGGAAAGEGLTVFSGCFCCRTRTANFSPRWQRLALFSSL